VEGEQKPLTCLMELIKLISDSGEKATARPGTAAPRTQAIKSCGDYGVI
jgi:hypothetical protein